MPEDKAEICVACGGRVAIVLPAVFDTRFGIETEFHIGRCGNCGLEQTLPRPSPADLNDYYARHYNFGGERGTAYTNLRARFLSSSLYRLWLAVDGDISFHERMGQGRLIDIGCNEGRGLKLYSANGFTDVEGLETNPVAAEAARKGGFIVHGVELADFQPTEPYDVAVLSNVLEHALDPAAMLGEVRRTLRPGGQIWISCPNAASWQRFLFGRFWINWHVPFHIVHFREDSLTRALETNDFENVEHGQISPALWLAHSVLALTSQRGRPTRALRNPIAVLLLMALARFVLFPILWFGNRVGRGDCLIRIARRR